MRIALAEEVGTISSLITDIRQNEEVIGILKQTMIDCFKKLFSDKDAEVRLIITRQIDKIYKNISPETATEAITAIASNKTEKWVIKSALAESVQRLIEDKVDVRSIVEDLVPMLVDEAYRTRELISDTIVSASIQFGVDWLSQILEQIVRFAKGNTSSYQNRVTCAACLCGVLRAYLKHQTQNGLSGISEVLAAYCQDKSVFIRQQLVTSIRDVLMYAADLEGDFYAPVHALLKQMLEQLSGDEAEDVRQEAEELQETLE